MGKQKLKKPSRNYSTILIATGECLFIHGFKFFIILLAKVVLI